MKTFICTIVLLLAPFAGVYAGEADVVSVDVAKSADGSCQFDVTVTHEDTGWDHYADKWEVVGPDDTVLGTRTLQHPHVNEQPFTRSLSGVKIPQGIKRVTIRAHDSVHDYGGTSITVDVPR